MARISVACDDELHNKMAKLFPRGTLAPVVRRVCELLCERIEKDGVVVIELLISAQYNPIKGIAERGKLV